MSQADDAFQISDYTSISDWELVTEQLSGLSETSKSVARIFYSFGQKALRITRCQAEREGPVYMIDNFGYKMPFDSEGKAEFDMSLVIPRIFNVGEFYLIEAVDRNYLTESDCRLLLSSIIFKGCQGTYFARNKADSLIGCSIDPDGFIVEQYSFNPMSLEPLSQVIEELPADNRLVSRQITITAEPLKSLNFAIKRAIEEKNEKLLWFPWTSVINPISMYRCCFLWPNFRLPLDEAIGEDDLFEAPISLLQVVKDPISSLETDIGVFFGNLECTLSERQGEKVRDWTPKREPGNFTIALMSHLLSNSEPGSFYQRLCKVVGLAFVKEGLIGLAEFWHELTTNVLPKYHESLDLLPIESGECEFNLNLPLLYQKLLVLNYCIQKELRHIETYGCHSESRVKSKLNKQQSGKLFIGLNLSSESLGNCAIEEVEDLEVFYDLPSETLDNSGPQGRSHQLDDLHLISDDSEPLYVPFTQEYGHCTLDNLLIQESILMEDCSTPKTELKLKLQSRQLISDAEAFKAANPKAKFEDFVRWYSPKDWLPEGCLSLRMGETGNHWRTIWDGCQAIPVSRQKLIFDQHREAEKCLFYLEDIQVAELLSQVIPSLPIIIQSQLDIIAAGLRIPCELPKVEKSVDLSENICRLENQSRALSIPYHILLDMPEITANLLSELLTSSSPSLTVEESDRASIEAYLKTCPQVVLQKETVIKSADHSIHIYQVDKEQYYASRKSTE